MENFTRKSIASVMALCFVFVSIFGTSTIVVRAVDTPATNLITNGDMEQDSTWSNLDATYVKYTTDKACSGTRSMQIKSDGTGRYARIAVTVTPGKSYVLTFKHYGAALGSVTVGSGTIGSFAIAPVNTGVAEDQKQSYDWTTYKRTVTVPTTFTGTFNIDFKNSVSGSTAYIDDVAFEEAATTLDSDYAVDSNNLMGADANFEKVTALASPAPTATATATATVPPINNDGWYCSSTSAIIRDTSDKVDGQYSMKFISPGNYTFARDVFSKLDRYTTYELSFYHKGAANGNMRLGDAFGKQVLMQSIPAVDNWTKYVFTFNTGAGGSRMFTSMYLYNSGADHWYDCFNLKKIETTLPSDMPTVVPGGTTTDFTVAQPFTDGMVVQRRQNVNVYGTASTGREVTVTFNGQVKTAVADMSGNWNVVLDPMEAGGPYTMDIYGDGVRVAFANVMVGEVWLLGGQSNSVVVIDTAANASTHYAVDNPYLSEPQLKFFNVNSWTTCGTNNTQYMPALGYFFAKKLQACLDSNVTVGIIPTGIGASNIQVWFDPLTKSQMNNTTYDGLGASAYESNIKKFVGYSMKGVLWNQGENNTQYNFGSTYSLMLRTMIKNWRTLWGTDLTFVVDQLPFINENVGGTRYDLNPQTKIVETSWWADIRNAQVESMAVKNVGLVATYDTSPLGMLHPYNKDKVGERSAYAALALAYGQDREYVGPIVTGYKVVGNKLELTFKHANGMAFKDGATDITGMGIAAAPTTSNPNPIWYQATATIEGNKLYLSSPNVDNPVQARYMWADNCTMPGNLVNAEGYLAPGFKVDSGVTFAYSWENETPTPTVDPNYTPTATPITTPTPTATATATATATVAPTVKPTATPTLAPTVAPIVTPTLAPTAVPTATPTLKAITLKKVTPSSLSSKTSKISGVTSAKATVKLMSGSKLIKKVTASSKGVFTFTKLSLKKYKGKSLKIVITKSGYKAKSKTWSKIKK